MARQCDIAEAKDQLSELLDAATAGEDVVILRSGRPVARLVPIGDDVPRRLGFLGGSVPDALFDQLNDDEVTAWS
ncbi:MAG: type II toxin-antitoxin system prevent-host-death family antitoxin [Actinomycetota bacterium]